MSHEIRTPLGAIMGFADLARDPGASAADVASYLGIVERNSIQVMRIIDDILDLAKVEAGRVELEKMKFPLASFLADCASLMGFRARENGISLGIVAGSDLPDAIISDPTRLRKILTNAVGNAIKFTASASVTVRVRLAAGVLHFGVEDTGRGISPDQAHHLFRAFSQADVSTTRKFGGTGLGLVLATATSMGAGAFLRANAKNDKFNLGDNADQAHLAPTIGGGDPSKPPTVGTVANNAGGGIPGQGSGGAGGAGGGRAGGGGGGAPGYTTNIEQGLRSGGYSSPTGSSDPNGGGAIGGGGEAGGAPNLETLDLRSYLPGGTRAPAAVGHLSALQAESMGIYGPHVNIWQKISDRLQAKCRLGELFDCR